MLSIQPRGDVCWSLHARQTILYVPSAKLDSIIAGSSVTASNWFALNNISIMKSQGSAKSVHQAICITKVRQHAHWLCARELLNSITKHPRCVRHVNLTRSTMRKGKSVNIAQLIPNITHHLTSVWSAFKQNTTTHMSISVSPGHSVPQANTIMKLSISAEIT